VALVRIEQLYPFPSDEYQAMLNRYPNAREVVWCQEEPQNQAPGTRSSSSAGMVMGRRPVLYAGRGPSAAPATGITKIHEIEQQTLVAAALHATTTEESARETTRLTAAPVVPAPTAASAPCAARAGHPHKKAFIMTTEIRVPQLPESIAGRHARGVAQQPVMPSAATRISPISRPTRWC